MISDQRARPTAWGRLSGFVRAFGAAGVMLTLQNGQRIEHAEPLQLVPAGAILVPGEVATVRLD